MGLMRGSSDDAVSEGAHALFFPHGLGHMLGLDVHDMEGLGEDLVGYDDDSKLSRREGGGGEARTVWIKPIGIFITIFTQVALFFTYEACSEG